MTKINKNPRLSRYKSANPEDLNHDPQNMSMPRHFILGRNDKQKFTQRLGTKRQYTNWILKHTEEQSGIACICGMEDHR